MSKEQSKKPTSAPSKAKKGAVIDRRRNRTVPEGFAKSEPKWELGAHGTLIRKGSSAHGPRSNPIHLVGPQGFASVAYKGGGSASFEDDKVWEKVGIPQPAPSAAGLPQEV